MLLPILFSIAFGFIPSGGPSSTAGAPLDPKPSGSTLHIRSHNAGQVHGPDFTTLASSWLSSIASHNPSNVHGSRLNTRSPSPDAENIGDIDSNVREISDIVWSCLWIVFACTWISMHPNVLKFRSSWKERMWNRIRLMGMTVLAPEILVLFSVRQWVGARKILKVFEEELERMKAESGESRVGHASMEGREGSEIQDIGEGAYNGAGTRENQDHIEEAITVDEAVNGVQDEKVHKTSNHNTDTLFPKIKNHNLQLTNGSKVNSDTKSDKSSSKSLGSEASLSKPHWTLVHSHFLQMGGYIFREGPRGHLQWIDCGDMLSQTPRARLVRLALLKRTTQSDTADEIMDKSKGDGLAKAFVLCQTLWFVVNCIARALQGLNVTKLEVVAIAYAVLSGFSYFFWWDKPLDVQCPCVVEVPFVNLKEDEVEEPHEEDAEEAMDGDLGLGIEEKKDMDVKSKLEAKIKVQAESKKDQDLLKNEKLFQGQEINETPNSPPTETEYVPSEKDPTLDIPQPTRSNISPPEPQSQRKAASHEEGDATSINTTESHVEPPAPAPEPENESSRTLRFLNRLTVFFETVAETGDEYQYGKNGTYASHIDSSAPRYRIFYAYRPDDARRRRTTTDPNDADWYLEIPECILASLYGAIHCIAWHFRFHSSIAQLLWRISALTVVAFPQIAIVFLVLFTSSTLDAWMDSLDLALITWLVLLFGLVVVLMALCVGAVGYVGARIILIVLAFIDLAHLPPSALRTVEWTQFLPHVGG